MDEETIQWILTDTSVDPVSTVPTSAVVFMLYYGLELKHFLLKISNDIVSNFNPGIRDYGDTSLYLAGSAAQGFYLNTNDFLDARDIDIVSILRKEVRNECEFDKKQLQGQETEVIDQNENHGHCKGILKENSTIESPPTYLNVETWEDTYPGYVMLRKCRKDELPVQTSLSHRYVSSLQTTRSRAEYWNEMQSILADVFRSGLDEEWGNDVLVYDDVLTQGPAASSMFTNIFLDVQLNADLVFALPYPGWPEIAKEWKDRKATSGWPSLEVKQDIVKSGCLIVPKGQLGSGVEEYEWRISFSFAELKLSRTLNHVQREIVHVLKAFLSDKKEHGFLGIEAKLDSYFVINLLYTESEKINTDDWTEINIAKLVFSILDKLESSIRNKNLPHYFIPANNLLHKYTFKSVKLSKGEFKRGYGDENEMMDIDEYIDFALYAVMRLRYDPLGQVLQQSKYVQLSGSIRQAVFEPLVTQAKHSSKVDGKMYLFTVLRLAKAHLFQLRFREANLYTEDCMKFYKALRQSEITEHMKSELHVLRALTAYLDGNYDIAKRLFEEIEKESQTTKITLIESNTDIFSIMYARTLLSCARKCAGKHGKDLQLRSEKLFQTAINVSSESSRPVVNLHLLNYFMNIGRYEEAVAVLNEIKSLQGIEDNLESSGDIEDFDADDDHDKSEAENRGIEENQDASASENSVEMGAPYPPKQREYCPKYTHECDVPFYDTQSDVSGIVEAGDVSSISSDEGVVMETGSQIIYTRKKCEENVNMEFDAENLISEEQNNADSKLDSIETNNEKDSDRAKLNLFDNQDLLNQYALFQALTKLGLNEYSNVVYQKLLKKVQERQMDDSSVTIGAIEHDYMFYMSIKTEPPIEEDWENPFTIFKEQVVISPADEYILDDILKSLVERYGVVGLSVPDMYFHYRVQLLKYEGKASVALALIENIKDQNLVALHYHSLGETEKAEDAAFYARLDRDGGGKLVSETLKQWVTKMLEAARKYEPRNVYLDSVFS